MRFLHDCRQKSNQHLHLFRFSLNPFLEVLLAWEATVTSCLHVWWFVIGQRYRYFLATDFQLRRLFRFDDAAWVNQSLVWILLAVKEKWGRTFGLMKSCCDFLLLFGAADALRISQMTIMTSSSSLHNSRSSVWIHHVGRVPDTTDRRDIVIAMTSLTMDRQTESPLRAVSPLSANRQTC